MGRTIAETVTFRNGSHVYEVSAGFDRLTEDGSEAELRSWGGIDVSRGVDRLFTATCRPEPMAFAWRPPLNDAMEAAGLLWDMDARACVPAFPLVPAPPAP